MCLCGVCMCVFSVYGLSVGLVCVCVCVCSVSVFP